jgi:8-oxo-dGTP pyrophosphatase MutT (NUDIX family)
MHNGQLLCVRHRRPVTFTDKDFWCLPGGKLETGESIKAGLSREIVEELGVKPVIGRLRYVQQYGYGDRHEQEAIEFFFQVTNNEDFLNINLADTALGEKEIGEVAFINPKEHKILPTFLATESLDAASDETQFFSSL